MSKTGHFFDNEADLKKFISVNSTVSISDLEVKLFEAGNTYVIPKIGDLYETALLAYKAENNNNLIPFIQRALANFAMLHHLPFLEVQIGESGVFRYETDNEKTAYKYQKDALRAALLESGFMALERLVSHIESNLNDYTWYRDNEASPRCENNKNLINSSLIFNRHYRLNSPAATFDYLRPVVDAVETFVIRPYIGDDYFDLLQINQKNNNLSQDDKVALVLIQKAIANFVIQFSTRAGAGQMTPNGFKIIEQNSENKGFTTPTIDQITMANSFVNMNGYMYISKLLKLLSTPNKYPLYKLFAAEEKYEEFDQTDKAIYRI